MVTLHQCAAQARPPARNLRARPPAAQPILLPCLHRTLPMYVRAQLGAAPDQHSCRSCYYIARALNGFLQPLLRH